MQHIITKCLVRFWEVTKYRKQVGINRMHIHQTRMHDIKHIFGQSHDKTKTKYLITLKKEENREQEETITIMYVNRN